MTELLGYSHDEFLGKELWEIGLFSDKSGNEAACPRTARERLYPLRPLAARNQARASGPKSSSSATSIRWTTGTVTQCNIRDISERSRLERKMQEQAEALADLHRRKDEFLAMLSPRTPQPARPHLQRRATPASPEERGPTPAASPHHH